MKELTQTILCSECGAEEKGIAFGKISLCEKCLVEVAFESGFAPSMSNQGVVEYVTLTLFRRKADLGSLTREDIELALRNVGKLENVSSVVGYTLRMCQILFRTWASSQSVDYIKLVDALEAWLIEIVSRDVGSPNSPISLAEYKTIENKLTCDLNMTELSIDDKINHFNRNLELVTVVPRNWACVRQVLEVIQKSNVDKRFEEATLQWLLLNISEYRLPSKSLRDVLSTRNEEVDWMEGIVC